MVKGKRKILIGVVLMLWLCLGMGVLAQSSKVFDQAGLLTPGEVQKLEEKAQKLGETYQMNFVAVTTLDAQGKSAREYADDFYMDYGFSNEEQNGGVTILIDLDNGELYLSTAGDMRYYLTNARVERVLDAGYDLAGNKEYAECISSMMDQTVAYIEQGIDPNQYTKDTDTGKIVRYKSLRTSDILIAVAAALGAAGLACGGIIGKYRLKWGTYTYPYKQKGKLNVRNRQDILVNQFITQRRIPRNDNRGSGGGGGGGGMSSIHTSSGGGSFGGGGRKL